MVHFYQKRPFLNLHHYTDAAVQFLSIFKKSEIKLYITYTLKETLAYTRVSSSLYSITRPSCLFEGGQLQYHLFSRR